MNYFNLTNQTQHTESEIRSANPNTSFPQPFIPPTGYELVFPSPQPAHNPVAQSVREITPVLTSKGHYEQSWEVVELFTDQVEKDAAIASSQVAAFQAAVIAFDTALTAHMDNTAKQRRYDNRITCAVRAGYSGPFQAEGAAFALWMDNCNALAYQMLAAVQAGTAPMPESPQAFIDTLPVMVWPA